MAFLSFVPAVTGRITEMGRRTLYVFLLHGLIVRTVVAKGVYEYIDTPVEVMLIVVCAAGLCCMLTMPWVRTATRPLIEPQVEWMLGYQLLIPLDGPRNFFIHFLFNIEHATTHLQTNM